MEIINVSILLKMDAIITEICNILVKEANLLPIAQQKGKKNA